MVETTRRGWQSLYQPQHHRSHRSAAAFGGWKCSSIGPGSKAGGPNYVNLFRTLHDDQNEDFTENYREAWETHFLKEHDPSGLKCERNQFRYRPVKGVILRLQQSDERTESMARAAAEITGAKLLISLATTETTEQLALRISEISREIEFLRTVGSPPDDAILRAAYSANLNWINTPFVSKRTNRAYPMDPGAISVRNPPSLRESAAVSGPRQ